MAVHLRTLTTADIDAVVVIEQSIQPHPWRRSTFVDCCHANYHSYILEVDKKIVGYAIMAIAVDECHIMNLGVHPGYQRQGFGRMLVQHIIEQAQQMAVQRIFLEVRVSNGAAQGLYQQLGFQAIGKRRDYYPLHEQKREDAVVMSRKLQ